MPPVTLPKPWIIKFTTEEFNLAYSRFRFSTYYVKFTFYQKYYFTSSRF